MQFYYTYMRKFNPLGVGHFQTHNFGAVLENLHKLVSGFSFPLVQSGFKLKYSVLMSMAFLSRSWLWYISKEKITDIVRWVDRGGQGILPKHEITRLRNWRPNCSHWSSGCVSSSSSILLKPYIFSIGSSSPEFLFKEIAKQTSTEESHGH